MGIISIWAAALTSTLVAQVAELTQAPEHTPSSIDLSVTAQSSFFSFNDISTATSRAGYTFFTQRGAVTLKIKEDPWVFNFRMEHISLAGVSDLPAPLANASTRYPRPGPGIFVSQAYLGYDGLWQGLPLSFKAGSIPIGKHDSLLLDDNGLGIFGFQAEFKDIGPFRFEYLTGNAETSAFGSDKIIFNYVGTSFERTGRWTLGFLAESDKTLRTLEAGPLTSKARRNSLDLHYDQRSNNFSFHGEFVLSQGGYHAGATPAEAKKVKTRATAYAIEGLWRARVPKLESLGLLEWSFLYSFGSGDNKNTEVDEAYFAPLATRFDGTRRTGWGKVLGASAFDTLASTGTWNGLPTGLSGVSTIGLGIKSKPYSILDIPLRFAVKRYEFRATESAGLSKALGGEWSFEISTEFTERFNVQTSFYRFTPDQAYEADGNIPKAIQGLQAIATLSFE